MSTIVRWYTKKTLREHASEKERLLTLCAISNSQSQAGGTVVLEPVSDRIAQERMDDCLIFGLFPGEFGLTFSIDDLNKKEVPNPFVADITWNGTLNFADCTTLAALLSTLHQQEPGRECWSENDLSALFPEAELKLQLQNAVNQLTCSGRELVETGGMKLDKTLLQNTLPSWLKTLSLNVAFLYCENGAETEFEREYNRRARKLKEESLRNQLAKAAATVELDARKNVFIMEEAAKKLADAHKAAMDPIGAHRKNIVDAVKANVIATAGAETDKTMRTWLGRFGFAARHPFWTLCGILLLLTVIAWGCSMLTTYVMPCRVEVAILNQAGNDFYETVKSELAANVPKFAQLEFVQEEDGAYLRNCVITRAERGQIRQILDKLQREHRHEFAGNWTGGDPFWSISDGGLLFFLKKTEYRITLAQRTEQPLIVAVVEGEPLELEPIFTQTFGDDFQYLAKFGIYQVNNLNRDEKIAFIETLKSLNTDDGSRNLCDVQAISDTNYEVIVHKNNEYLPVVVHADSPSILNEIALQWKTTPRNNTVAKRLTRAEYTAFLRDQQNRRRLTEEPLFENNAWIVQLHEAPEQEFQIIVTVIDGSPMALEGFFTEQFGTDGFRYDNATKSYSALCRNRAVKLAVFGKLRQIAHIVEEDETSCRVVVPSNGVAAGTPVSGNTIAAAAATGATATVTPTVTTAAPLIHVIVESAAMPEELSAVALRWNKQLRDGKVDAYITPQLYETTLAELEKRRLEVTVTLEDDTRKITIAPPAQLLTFTVTGDIAGDVPAAIDQLLAGTAFEKQTGMKEIRYEVKYYENSQRNAVLENLRRIPQMVQTSENPLQYNILVPFTFQVRIQLANARDFETVTATINHNDLFSISEINLDHSPTGSVYAEFDAFTYYDEKSVQEYIYNLLRGKITNFQSRNIKLTQK